MKQHVRGVALALLAGAVVTVGVAWACTLLVQLPPSHMRAEPLADGRWLGYFYAAGFGTETVTTGMRAWEPADVDTSSTDGSVLLMDRLSISVRAVAAPRPAWARLEPDDPRVAYGEQARGWPRRAMWDIALPFDPPRLPLRLIWPGFAVNTVLYTAALWLLFVVPLGVRRRLRARRGCCPQCGYPAGRSAVCPECGGALGARGIDEPSATTSAPKGTGPST